VLVVGGGPAGCAAARLLALWGHEVELVTREMSGSPLPESIPPSCGKLFDLLGIRDVIDAAGFARTTGNSVWWGSGDLRVEQFAGGERGWQVTAHALESILQDAARAAHARIRCDRVTLDSIPTDPAFILDCTGRTGVIARSRGWRQHESDRRTVALVAAWRPAAPWAIPDPTHTVLESYADGWAWSVPSPDGHRFVTVMVDPRTSDLARGEPARTVYLTEIAKTVRFAQLLEHASMSGGPWGWDCSMYGSTRYADDTTLIVGDAGSFIDPLSSIGVKKALASGWLAAVAAHTALVRPEMRATAFDFFAAREAEVYASFRSLTMRFLASAAVAHTNPFWTDRAGAVDHDVVADDAALGAAFTEIRSAASIALHRAPALRIEQRPAVSGSEIVLQPRIVTASQPAGVRYVSDVDLLALIELAPSHRQVPDLFEAYNRRHAPVTLPDFLTALATAVARGFLVNRQVAK
jgi:flavin-dependent dehydrogenase